MIFIFLTYFILIFPLKVLSALIILIVLYIKKKQNNIKVLLRIWSLVIVIITVVSGIIIIYMRTVRRLVPEEYAIYAPMGIANKYINRNAYDGRNEAWLFKLTDKENKEAYLNVCENSEWNELSKEDYDRICFFALDINSCNLLLSEKNVELNYEYTYFSVYDFSSGQYMSPEAFQTIDYVSGNFLILIFDSSIQYYYALRTS